MINAEVQWLQRNDLTRLDYDARYAAESFNLIGLGGGVFQQVRSDSCRHLVLTGMSRFLLSKPKQQDLLTV